MNLLLRLTLLTIVLTAGSCTEQSDKSNAKGTGTELTPKKVELRLNENEEYRLYVNNEEFFIKGAGLEHGDRAALAKHGANSFRTWRTDNGDQSGMEVLNEALENGLMVTMGIEVGRERHGYDYNDEKWVAQQKEEIRLQVIELKDHPALLAWGIGNELNLRYANKKVWDAVNDIAKMIHKIDGNHPTTTMLAGIGKNEVEYIEANCPDIDFISIQMYGDIINLEQRMAEANFSGPYIVTEWGATGHWEVGTTAWGAPIEQSSTEKALSVAERYEKVILSDTKNCMGSYVFLWGQKQERTPTWYGLFTENGEEMEPIERMHYYWNNNTWPENRNPKILSAFLNDKKAVDNVYVKGGQEVVYSYETEDPDGDAIEWRFEVLPEASDLGDGGDHEDRPEPLGGLMISETQGEIKFRSPDNPGAYRAFLYLLDGNNHAATINIPFYVEE